MKHQQHLSACNSCLDIYNVSQCFGLTWSAKAFDFQCNCSPTPLHTSPLLVHVQRSLWWRRNLTWISVLTRKKLSLMWKQGMEDPWNLESVLVYNESFNNLCFTPWPGFGSSSLQLCCFISDLLRVLRRGLRREGCGQ